MASKRTRRAKHRTKPTTTAAQRRRGRSYATARSVVNSAEREPIELKDHEVEEGLATGEHSGLLEDYFGSAQYSELRNLAQEAAVRGKRGGDRVLILPGIMGSKLGYRGSLLFDDVIWANPVAIAFGRLSELRLGAKRNGVDALGVLQFAYLKLKLKLQIAGHDAEFFPYDWRTSLSQIGKKLANEIKSGRPTHLVAHSMGGLVARAALPHKPRSLGRIIMLGTPNFGSFAPIQAFRGAYSLMQKIDFIDSHHSAADLADIFGTFSGLCEMIPSPKTYPADFFNLDVWPDTGSRPSQSILTAARKTQAQLPVDYDDLVIIAGIDQETVVDAKVDNHEFVYTKSHAGDGTVPLQCVLLPSAKHTYYVAEEHGSLPNNGDVARAVDAILSNGETDLLSTQYQPARGLAAFEIGESALQEPPYVGNRGRALSAREKRTIVREVAAPDEKTITAPLEKAPTLASGLATTEADSGIPDAIVVGRRRQHRLDVTLAYGSITEVEADAYALGMFNLVPPAGAASAVDERMGGAIQQMFARRMFNANIGQISILPTGKHPVRADVIAFAGLGAFDNFKEDVLEIVGENLVRTFISTRIDDFATVPIGGATGAFTPEALHSLMSGFLRGLQDADRDNRFRGITICETDRERFNALQREFYRLCGTHLFDDVEVTLREIHLPEPALPAVSRRDVGPSVPPNVFLIVRQESSQQADPIEYGCSVLTAGSKATVFKARQTVKRKELDDHLAKLGTDEGLTLRALPKFGDMLANLVLPPSIHTVLGRQLDHPLVVVHDASSSRIPWETLRIDGKFPALQNGLSHRYEADDLSIAKWLEERQRSTSLNVLVVANPTGDLPGAKAEGDRIRALLEELKPAVIVQSLVGKDARKAEVLNCLRSGKFDVIHYAGHAYFDTTDPSKSGILCAGDEVLAGADLANIGSLPSLVFFNACESGRLRRGAKTTEIDDEKHTVDRVHRGVSFAEAFLRGGIANYLGTYWPVNDNAALAFSENFYRNVLRGETLGSAIMAGRKAVKDISSADWADYILYGDTNFVLKTRSTDPSPRK